ncbi:uncharacterized protein [Arachis hypogaea]|uniref:uncharacterized protein n=1 Tax=Arachis hypogaea TaxID=3818 RepID=UPI000DEE0EB5|nr:zinc finger MYM-type protein 1-like [Arachis hypogaea]
MLFKVFDSYRLFGEIGNYQRFTHQDLPEIGTQELDTNETSFAMEFEKEMQFNESVNNNKGRRGHDESQSSSNRGNFLEMLKFLGSYNERVKQNVLENAPKNAKYTSNDVQKEILHILATKVRNSIREEIGDAKFCIIVDEARDESKKEQMAIVLRFVTLDGFVKERFFDLVHVTDTCATTLKKELIYVLSHYNLQVENIRGQGYDGASNMRGEWNSLQALFLKDSPQAYYVHCFAHRLQLALVAASREVLQIHEFFTQLNSIITIVSASSKRHDQLQEAQAIENANLVAQNELETGKGANQISTLQRVGDTRWSSHFNSICSLVKMFTATNIVLNNIIEDGTTYAQRGEAYGVSKILLSFEFVFTLHLMKEIMGITNVLCQALQQQSQDILNAMHIFSTSKLLLQQLRDGGWCNFLANVKDFCEKHEIEVPNMSAQYVFGRGRSRQPSVTVEYHYRIDVFLATIDSQIQELNSRFNEQTIELLTLSCALDPKDNFKSFNIEEISKLAEKFYPLDFPSNELNILKSQLQHYQHDIPNHLKGIGTLSELCNKLQKMGKSRTYHIVDRLIRLVLTLPVSTATTERAFSAMKIVKTRLRNKMADEFLADNLVPPPTFSQQLGQIHLRWRRRWTNHPKAFGPYIQVQSNPVSGNPRNIGAVVGESGSLHLRMMDNQFKDGHMASESELEPHSDD